MTTFQVYRRMFAAQAWVFMREYDKARKILRYRLSAGIQMKILDIVRSFEANYLLQLPTTIPLGLRVKMQASWIHEWYHAITR